MADELSTKRIINLAAASAPAEGDNLVIDSETNGTKRLPIQSLIEDTPTEGSTKVLSSGGAFTEFSKLKENITSASGINLYDPETRTAGYSIDGTTGEPFSSASWDISDFIGLDVGVRYYIKLFNSTGSATVRYAVYDANKNFVARVIGGAGETVKYITTNAGTRYLRIILFNDTNTSGNSGDVLVMASDTEPMEFIPYNTAFDRVARNSISDMHYTVSNPLQKTNLNTGYYKYYSTTIDGIITESNASLSYSDPIAVIPDSAIHLENIFKTAYSYCIWLDINQKPIGKATASTTGSTTSNVRVDAPPNAYYMIVNIHSDYVDTWNVSYYTEDQDSDIDTIKYNYKERIDALYADVDNAVGKRFGYLTRPCFTLTDDDTTSFAYVKEYHDICEDLGVLGNYAAITFRLQNDQNLADLLLEYEKEGHGVYLHCHKQIDAYNTVSSGQWNRADAEADFVQGLREYKEFGFTVPDIWLTPFGTQHTACIAIGRRHGIKYIFIGAHLENDYSANVTTSIFNKVSRFSERYRIYRAPVGVWADDDPDHTNTYTMAQLKAMVDECAETNGMINFTTHVNQWYDDNGNTLNNEGESRMREIIEYCKAKGLWNCNLAEYCRMYEPMYRFSDEYTIKPPYYNFV